MLKRWMCAFLAIAMCVSLLPVSALGAEIDTTAPSESVTGLAEEPLVTVGEEETEAVTEAATVPAETAATEAATESTVAVETTEAVEETVEATETTEATEAPTETEATEATEATEVILCVHGAEGDCPVCALEARLSALPEEDAVSAMTEEEKAALQEELEALLEAYNALTAEQQAMVTGMERLTALYAVLTVNATVLDAAGESEPPYEGKYLNGEFVLTPGQKTGDTFKIQFLTAGSGATGTVYYTLYYSETNEYKYAQQQGGEKTSNSLTYSFVPEKAGYYWVLARMVNGRKEESKFADAVTDPEDYPCFQVLSMAFDQLTVNKAQFTTGETVEINAIIRAAGDPAITYTFYKYAVDDNAGEGELADYVKVPTPDNVKPGNRKLIFTVPDEEAMPDGAYLVAAEFETPEGETLRKTCKFTIYRGGLKLDAIITQDINGTKTNKFCTGESIGVGLKYSGKANYNGVIANLYFYDKEEKEWCYRDTITVEGEAESGIIPGITFGGVYEEGTYKITVSLVDENGQQWLPLTTTFTVSGEHIHRYNPEPVKIPAVKPSDDPPAKGNRAYSYLECIYCDEEEDGHYATIDGTPMTWEQFKAFVESNTLYCKATSVDINVEIPEEAGDSVSYTRGENGSISVDFTMSGDNTPLESVILWAVVNPEGEANPKVSWSTTNSAVAKITNAKDDDGNDVVKVTPLKPGNAVISAKTLDGSGKKASVTVNVCYKYNTKNINLGLALQDKQGLQVTETATLTAWCDDGTGINLSDLDIKIASGGAYVKWDKEDGTLTGVKPGAFKIKATLVGDPLGRKAELSGKVIPIVPDSCVMIDYSAWGVVGADQYIEMDGFISENSSVTLYQKQSTKTQTYTLTLVGYNSQLLTDELNNNFAWTSSNSKLATATMNTTTGKVTITVKANQNGECDLTAVSKYNANVKATIHVVVHDYQPKLNVNQITMNIAKENDNEQVILTWNELDDVIVGNLNFEGGLRLINTRNGQKVDEFDIVDADIQDGATEATITIGKVNIPGQTMKPGTWKLMLEVPTEHSGKPYQLPLTVVVQENKPTVTIKQTRKVNLKGVDGYGVLEFSAKAGKETVTVLPTLDSDYYELVGTDKENVYWIVPLEGASTKNNSKLTLTVAFDNYDGKYTYVKKNFAIGVESKIVTKTINSYLTKNTVYTDLVKGFTDNGFEVITGGVECKQQGFMFEGKVEEKDKLSIAVDQTVPNGTYNLFVTVSNGQITLTGQVNVVVKNVLPTVTVKQTKRVNLLDPDSMGLLVFTAKGTTVETVTAENMDFDVWYDAEVDAWRLECTGDRLSAKLDRVGTLKIGLGGEYHEDVVVTKSITVATEKTKDKAYLESKTLTLYRKLQNMEDSTKLSGYFESTLLNNDVHVKIKNADQYKGLHIEYDENAQKLRTWFDSVTPIKAGSYKYNIEVTMDPTKPKEITKLSVTVKVVEAPKVTISPTAVKLSYSDLNQKPAVIKVTGTKFGDAELTGFTILADETKNQYPFAEWFAVEQNEETQEWEVSLKTNTYPMQPGRTYAVKLQPEFTSVNGTDVGNPIVLKITMAK